MLNVPDAVKELIKSDSVRKNFRVHFPNVEMADLTNENIVAESVRFTESICSGETFKFGSADASMIEFETVGVPNILGATIECSMEYAVPDNLQATYGTWYSIPYGVFVVDSCPRNHKSMAHRKVTAYSRRFTNAFLPAFEQWKMTRIAPNKYYEMNPYYFLAQYGIVTPGTEATQTGTAGSNAYQAYSNREDGQTVLRYFYGTYPASAYYVYDITDLDAIYQITITGDLDPLYEILEAHHISKDTPAVSATLEITTSGVAGSTKYHIPLRQDGYEIICDPLYPSCPQISNGDTVKLYVPAAIQLTYTDPNAPAHNWTDTAVIATAVAVKKLTSSADEASITLQFQRTLDASGGYYFYSAYSAMEIIKGFAELTGGMVRTNRSGTPELVYLDNSAPYALTAADVMAEAWWDEYDVAEVGTVKYDCTTKNGSQYSGQYVFNESKASIYDMTGNYILNHLKGATTSYIEGTLLKLLFKPKAGTITFTPVDANFRGLTYLQPGDAIQLTAADGAVVNSYILDQTFGGVQLITQDINTVQGQVIEHEY